MPGSQVYPARWQRAPCGPTFGPETVLPSQMFRRRRAHFGARALLAAILEDACHVVGLQVHGPPKWGRLHREARDWMASDDRSDICAFLSVCDVLEFDAAAIRKRYGITP